MKDGLYGNPDSVSSGHRQKGNLRVAADKALGSQVLDAAQPAASVKERGVLWWVFLNGYPGSSPTSA